MRVAGHGGANRETERACVLYATTREGILVIAPESGLVAARMPLEGAGALCRGDGMLFCAADDGVIWRIHPGHLAPMGLFYGGPEIAAMCADERTGRLYVLCAGADSLVMCSMESGQPLLINRAGVNPQGMMHARESGLIAAAGGEEEVVLLFCERTLRLIDAVPMPGMVCAAAVRGDRVYALCMDETLSAVLVTAERHGGARRSLRIPGLPGLLDAGGERLLVGGQEALYTASWDGARLIPQETTPVRAGKYAAWTGRARGCAVLDRAAQTLWLNRGTGWRLVLQGVRDILLCSAAMNDSGK